MSKKDEGRQVKPHRSGGSGIHRREEGPVSALSQMKPSQLISNINIDDAYDKLHKENENLKLALLLAKDMIIANEVKIPNTMEVIDKALGVD